MTLQQRCPEAIREVPAWMVYRGRLFLTVTDVSLITDTDPRTVRRAIEAGDIPAARVGRTVRIPAALFWPQVCGLDPISLQPLTATESPDAS